MQLSREERRANVRRAFSISRKQRLDGERIVLVDDVLTSGSTAEACAKALRKAGASRIELITWARVVRPSHLS